MAPRRVEAKASAAETVGSEAAEAGGVAAVAAAAEAGGVAAAVAAAVKAGGDTVAHAGSERIRRWWGRFGWPCLQRWGARAAARGSKRINHYLYINASRPSKKKFSIPPAFHPSLGLSIFFLSFFLISTRQGSTQVRHRKKEMIFFLTCRPPSLPCSPCFLSF